MQPYLVCTLLLWLLIGSLLLGFHLREDNGHRFLGIFGSSLHRWVVYDSALYLDMIEQSKEGAWLFLNRFSPEHGQPLYLNSIWMVMGKLAHLTSLSPLSAFTVLRFLVVPVFILALGRFLREALGRRQTQTLALYLILFCGGGIGWVFALFGFRDWFIGGARVETNPLLCLLVSPHIALSTALLLLVFSTFIRCSRGQCRSRWIAPLLSLAIATFHPYELPIIYSVGGLFLAALSIRDRKINRPLLHVYLLTIALSAPVLLYQRWSISTAPDLWGLKYDNDMPPDSLIRYILALFPIGLFGLQRLAVRSANLRSSENGQLMVVSWVAAIPALVHSFPVIPFAWKLGVAMTVPVYALAAEWIDSRVPGKGRMCVTAAVAVALSAFSAPVILGSMLKDARARSEPYYLPSRYVSAMRLLSKRGGWNDVVLSTKWPGITMPRFAQKRPFLGHYAVSVRYDQRKAYAQGLFRDGAPTSRELRELRSYGIRWIFCGKYEREWWPKLRPSGHFRMIYHEGQVVVYQVIYNPPLHFAGLPSGNTHSDLSQWLLRIP